MSGQAPQNNKHPNPAFYRDFAPCAFAGDRVQVLIAREGWILIFSFLVNPGRSGQYLADQSEDFRREPP